MLPKLLASEAQLYLWIPKAGMSNLLNKELVLL